MDDWKLEPAHDLGLPPRERARSLRREVGLVTALSHGAWWWATRGWLAVCHRLEIHGHEHLPSEPPFVLVANHSSHMDALVLAATLPGRLSHRVFPIAAGDTFFETSAAAAFAGFVLNALPMWRRHCGPHALRDLRDRLMTERCVYILFPEGTRSRDGAIHQFKSGVGMLLAGTRVPAVPCNVRGSFEAWPPQNRLPRPRRIHVWVGEPLVFPDVPDSREGWERVAAALETAVRALAG